MKKTRLLLSILLITAVLATFSACITTDNSEKYSVSYVAGEGIGDAPEAVTYEKGEEITLISNPFSKEGYSFVGWTLGETLYLAGDKFTVPANDVVFTATWEEIIVIPEPSFSQSSYEYDRLGGGDLELPIELDGANLVYLELDESILTANDWHYDATKKMVSIRKDIVLALFEGEHTVIAITDAETETPVSCKVIISQSLKTTFDEVTEKSFVYGKDSGVSFSVGYNGTTPILLTLADGSKVDEKYYSYDENSFTVKSEFLGKFSTVSNYRLYLSNNDSYEFLITSNVIFATDYDHSTIHDETASNIGHNPLYQYSDNVSIIDGPDGMDGKVLKITPNTVDVTYDCNGYYTLRNEVWESTWYKASFVEGKYYAISFDYMTEGTSVGEFSFKSVNTGWKEDLLLGAENDGVVHHFTTVVSYDEIGNGTYLWAKFNGGGGVVYVDNFRIAELDAVPSLTQGAEYQIGSGSYSVAFDNTGLAYKVLLNGAEVQTLYENGTLVIPESAMTELPAGIHELKVVTDVVTLSVELRVADNRVATFNEGISSYDILNSAPLKVYGSFDEGIELVSLKQKVKNSDNGYVGGWEFVHNDVTTDYSSLVSLENGADGSGYLLMPVSLLDCLWGQTTFIAEFSNGKTSEFTVDSIRVPMFTNYDETTLEGYLNGNKNTGSPLNSGLWGGSVANIESRGEGLGNALYIRSTEGAADACAFSIRFHTHPWDWFNVAGKEGCSYRVTFTYQISANLASKETYFYIMSMGDEDKDQNFFGSYDALDYVAGDNYHKVRYNLIADGEVHVFDSGWFTFSSALRMMKIQLPAFTASENAFVMLDDYRVLESKISNPLNAIGEYQIGQESSISFDIGTQTVSSLTLNGADIAYVLTDGTVTLDKVTLDSLAIGQYSIVLKTSEGTFKKSFAVSDNRVSNLSEVSKDVIRGQGAVTLAGEFSEGLNVISITRQGTISPWDTSVSAPASMSVEYVTVSANGLTLAPALVDQAYGVTSYVVTFDNGKSVEFVLNSSSYFYSNYDETDVFATLSGNSATCQDSAMWEVVDVEGNRKIKYTPSNAVLGHSVAALSGGVDNMILTFENRNVGSYNWWEYYFAPGDTIRITFDYEIVTGDKTSYYQFIWLDKDKIIHPVKLEGSSGTFSIDLDASNLMGWAINCPVTSKDLVDGTYMFVDNYGFGYVSDNYLNEHAKTVIYGGGEVTLKGSFADDLTVTSLKRYGDNYWDTSKTAASSLSVDYITLSASGLIVSAELINQVYGTEVFWVVLSNGETVRFTLTSNLLHFTNYDETVIHENVEGNIRSCQDTSMRSLVSVDGNNKIKYTPANAVLGHAVGWNADLMDNRIFTFSNNAVNHWWWEYDFVANSTVIVFFDYEVVANEKTPAYSFQWLDISNVWHKESLTGSGIFSIEIPANDLVAFGIGCPAASVDEISETYMIIDNFGFGLKNA